MQILSHDSPLVTALQLHLLNGVSFVEIEKDSFYPKLKIVHMQCKLDLGETKEYL